MNEAIKNINYVEGFLTALGATMQERERIVTETKCAVNKLRDVETFVKNLDGMIDSKNKDIDNYEGQIAELKAIIKEMQGASERNAKWISDGNIPISNSGDYIVTWKCSNCKRIYTIRTPYCPECGARMEVSRDD